MAKEFAKEKDEQLLGTRAPKKHARHPITMENTPEETIRRMRAFPQRAEKLRELIRALRETDAR